MPKMSQNRISKHSQGYILLYVLFLCSFLILFFTAFQGVLEKTFRGAQGTEKSVQEISSIQDVLILLKNTSSTSKEIPANENLSLVSTQLSGSIFSGSLGGMDPGEYWITTNGTTSTGLTLNIAQGGPLSYKLAGFNSGSESSAIVVASGMITANDTIANKTITLSGSFNKHILWIDPLGGMVRYTIDIRKTTFIPESSTYILQRNINGYIHSEGVYRVVNFIPHTYTGIDYQKIGMYLRL